MVTIHEKIRSHFVVPKSNISPSYLQEFASAVRGEIPYDSTLLTIEIWEDFLVHWLNGGVYEDKDEHMKLLYHTFQREYPYDGLLYCGIIQPAGYELYPKEVASYSTKDEVARYFAGSSDEYGVMELEEETMQHFIKVDAEGAFALDKFLRDVLALTKNEELKNEINDRIWEEEKIYPLPDYVLDGL